MSSSRLESPPLVDLSQCERERVHLPGAIQPHGALLVLDPSNSTIVAVSDNAPDILHRTPEALLGHGLDAIADGNEWSELVGLLGRADIEEHNPFKLHNDRGQRLDVIVHEHDGRIIVECEPEDAESEALRANVYNRVRRSLVRLRACVNLRDLCDQTAREVRALSGFDRVIVYRFQPDWIGEVVAEDCVDGVSRYAGLRFPASDIPSQARSLYTACLVRMVPTSTYAPARIVGAGERPLDLTHAALRSISPVHLEYMRNMGVTASLGISILYEGRLWGLITCNHESGRRSLPYEVRAACGLVGEVVSSLIAERQGVTHAEERATFLDTQTKLVQMVVQDRDVVRGLTSHTPSILDVTGSTGAALHYNGELHGVGVTPPNAALVALVSWLEEKNTDTLVIQSLPEVYPPSMAWKDVGCGLVASRIAFSDSSVVSQDNWLLWFRPEVAQTVSWGGDPNKRATPDETLRLHPRKSFELWKEEVHLKAMPFEPAQIEAARSLAAGLVDVILEIEASRLIRERTEQLRAREASLQLVLDATGDGLISVARDGTLLVERSRAFERWFSNAPRGALIWDVLFANEGERNTFACQWEQLASDDLPFAVSADQMPRELTCDGRCFELGFAEVREGRELSSILVKLQDVTERVVARRAARAAAESQTILASVLKDARGFGRILGELTALSKIVRNPSAPADARRALHTLKGNAALIGLDTLAELAHDAESDLGERGKHASVAPPALDVLDHELERVHLLVHEIVGDDLLERAEIPLGELMSTIAMLERDGNATEALARMRVWTLEPIARALTKLASRAKTLARALAKDVDVVVDDGNVRVDADAFEPLGAALVHAVSNAVDHGIERADERVLRGKSASGHIVVAARQSDSDIVFEIADDGRGVDFDALRVVARQRGLPCTTRGELLESLFASDLSTRAEVTSTSGRGMGLSALRETCSRFGGTVVIDTEVGVGTTLRVRIPRVKLVH